MSRIEMQNINKNVLLMVRNGARDDGMDEIKF